jgi:hypothetical protein
MFYLLEEVMWGYAILGGFRGAFLELEKWNFAT